MNILNEMIKWLTERLKPDSVREIFYVKQVPRHKYSFWYYWGGFTFFFLIVQLVTGVLLLFYYKPMVEDAHASVVYLTESVAFGSLVRSLHSWSASLLVLSAALHMFSVFFLRAYRRPRELQWMSGLMMFLIILGFGFTGFILPWNEHSYFGTLIGLAETEKFPLIGSLLSDFLKGGKHIGSATITRMFAVHTGVLPLLMLLLLASHLVLKRINGYSLPLQLEEKKSEVQSYKDFFYRASAGWLILLAILITIAVLLPKETGSAFDIHNLKQPPENIHPDWYFMFVFQTLKSESVIPPAITVLLISLFSLFWFFVPVLDRAALEGKNNRMLKTLGIFVILYVLVMTLLAYRGVGKI